MLMYIPVCGKFQPALCLTGPDCKRSCFVSDNIWIWHSGSYREHRNDRFTGCSFLKQAAFALDQMSGWVTLIERPAGIHTPSDTCWYSKYAKQPGKQDCLLKAIYVRNPWLPVNATGGWLRAEMIWQDAMLVLLALLHSSTLVLAEPCDAVGNLGIRKIFKDFPDPLRSLRFLLTCPPKRTICMHWGFHGFPR